MPGITQVRWCGFGGQGVVLAGLLLGQAGVLQGRYVAGSNSYGAQARGSGCKSEVVFSDGPIDFPHLTTADILVTMSQAAYDQYCTDVVPGGLIVYDAPHVTPRKGPDARQVGIPATDAALNKLRNKQAANIVLLGALVEMTSLVSPSAVERAIGQHGGGRFLKPNLEAFNTGREMGRQVHG